MKYFKIGDQVLSKTFGMGTVVDTTENYYIETYPVGVQFDKGTVRWFTLEGRFISDKEIDLYQLDKVTFQENEEIKDEYIPFTYEDYNLLMGKWIRHKNHKSLLCIIRIFETKIGTYEEFVTYEGLLKNYEFSSGEPCGKKVE